MTKISLNHFETTHVQVVLEQTAFLIFTSLWLCKFTYSIFSYLGTLEMDGMVSLTHAMKLVKHRLITRGWMNLRQGSKTLHPLTSDFCYIQYLYSILSYHLHLIPILTHINSPILFVLHENTLFSFQSCSMEQQLAAIETNFGIHTICRDWHVEAQSEPVRLPKCESRKGL